MPLKDYGVWVGYPTRYEAERSAQDNRSPHISLYFNENPSSKADVNRAAINVKSSTQESRLAYWFVRNFHSPITSFLRTLPVGYTELPSSEQQGLDYIRGNLFEPRSGSLLRHDVPGERNDIIDFLSPILDQAIRSKAKIFLFGEPFDHGIHDIHMNQGNTGKFKKDNGIYQDGGLIIQFPDDHFEGVFLAFGVQKVHTSDRDGSPIGKLDFATLLGGVRIDPAALRKGETAPGGSGRSTPTRIADDLAEDLETASTPAVPAASVIIRAALLNPVGPDNAPQGQGETVYILSRLQDAVDLEGWSLVNKEGQEQRLSGTLQPLGYLRIKVPEVPLSNKGGILTLLDDRGLKVDGVSWTVEQAKSEGDFVYFH